MEVNINIFEEGCSDAVKRYVTNFRPFNVGETLEMKKAKTYSNGQILYTDIENYRITKCEAKLIDVESHVGGKIKKEIRHVYNYYIKKI